MTKLTELPNVGKVLENNLALAGINSPEQLRSLGAKEAFLRIRKKADPNACLHVLYGLQGAIDNIPDKQLPAAKRLELKEFFNSQKAADSGR